jgi:hypothetical protein
MIPEDRRRAGARTRATRDNSQVEQLLVLVGGATALLLLLVL